MSRRQRAITILKKYQEALADKLTDLILDQEEQLMQEADGPDLGFTNDLYDLAEKLRAVSVTLNVMPAEQAPENPSFQAQNQVVVVTTLPRLTINDFLLMIEMEDYHRASVALSVILGVSVERASRCVTRFLDGLEMDQHPLTKQDTMSKLNELQSCTSMARAMDLLKDVFGLSPPEAVIAIQSIRANT